VPTCPSCGAANPDGFRHCGYCGAALAAPAPERRKLATLVFCDLSGSTALGEQTDSEATRTLMLSYFHEMRQVLERHGGTVEKFVGDAVLAVFGVPEAHEDDALRGCRAALEMQERMESLRTRVGGAGGRLAIRIGVNTGEVVAGDPASRETFVTGDPVNVAARLEQAAAPGEVLIGDATYRLVRGAVDSEPVPPIAARGKAEPVPAHRLVAVRATPASDRRIRLRFTGRERELALLDDAFADAVSGGCRLCTVAGEPGVGKSRLVAEFVSRLRDRARDARGTCLSYGDGITYWPVAEIVRSLAGADEEQSPAEALAAIELLVRDRTVARRIGQLLGLVEGAATVAETAAAVHELLRAAAADTPLVVVVDDLQWAEPTLLDLLAGLPSGLRGAPVLVLCIARPELLEARPAWVVDLPLEPFDRSDVNALLGDLLGNAPDGLVERLAAVSGGNPLFAEELVAMLEDDGRLVRVDGGCAFEGDLDALALPTSVSAIVGARLDRLEPALRATLEPAAVEGQTFHRDAVATLAGPAGQDAVAESLVALTRRDLVHPHGAGGETYRFKHILVRDTVYQTTAKRHRAALHEGYADWLERQVGSRAPEVEEILGYHLEQAHAYRVALGPDDDGVRALAERAAERLSRAGRRAARRGDVDAASHLLGRAAALLPEHGPERPRLLVHLGEALLEAGRNAEAETTLREVLAADGVDGATRLHATMCLGEIELQAAPTSAAVERLHRASSSAIELFAAHRDEQALLRTCWLSYLTSMITGRAAAAQAALDQLQVVAVSLAHPLAGRLPGMLAMNLAWGPVPVPDALAETTRLLDAVRGDPAAEPFVLGGHAYLLAQADELEAARAALARMRDVANRLGQRIVLWASWGQNVGRTELLAGDPERAERALRPCYQALRGAGDRGFSSTIAGQLAHALAELDRPEAAAAFAAEARDAAGEADVLSQLLWRSAMAKALAAQGDHDEAERLAAEAVALAEGTEWPNVLGDALLDQARVLQLAGRESLDPLARADVVYVAKRNAAGHRKAAALRDARTPTREGAT
jgi:class 3 adenylate cyclase/tetratricopeptide (TPR) repeat protein